MASSKPKISRREVARLAGVSPAVVYAALCGRETTISMRPETRERVLQIARELGYEPDVNAVGLATRRSYLVGFLARGSLRKTLSDLLEGMQEVFHPAGYAMLTLYHGQLTTNEAENLQIARKRRVDGLIVYPALDEDGSTNAATFRELTANGTPVVQLDAIADPTLPVARYDLVAAGAALTQHLLAQGHRRIAMLGHNGLLVEPAPGFYGHATWFWHGYQQAMAEAGLPTDFAAFPMLPGGREWTASFQHDLLATTIRLLQRHDRPTAILTGDGETSAIVMACQQLGLRIPQDVAVACFGPHSRDALNAIGQTPAYADLDATRLGTHAASLLLAALRGEPLSSAPMTAPIVPAT